MSLRHAAFFVAVCMPVIAQAQQDAPRAPVPGAEKPEEITVTGDRNRFQLRLQLMDAEKHAYDIFNRFNDEKRFEISCSTQQATGKFLTNQLCEPAFVSEASAIHANAYLQNLQNFMNPEPQPDMPMLTGIPREAAIASQQAAYRRKMREVAEEHPEFLEAMIRYSEIKAQYEGASDTE
jgi:hypothetical protein